MANEKGFGERTAKEMQLTSNKSFATTKDKDRADEERVNFEKEMMQNKNREIVMQKELV